MNEELKIGHCYNDRGIIYEVREEDKDNLACKNCAFYISEEGCCTDIFPERIVHCFVPLSLQKWKILKLKRLLMGIFQ